MALLTQNFSYLQPSGFKIIINRQAYPALQFLATSVTHPTVSIPNARFAIPRYEGISLPGDTLSFTNLIMEVILDEDLQSYNEMYSWMKRITTEHHNMIDQDECDGIISSDASIRICVVNGSNNVEHNFEYKNAVPVSLSAIQFASSVNTVDYVTFTAEFAISEFELDGQ